jgi:hypothetical protein
MKPRGDANVRALSDRRRAPCRCDWSSGVGEKPRAGSFDALTASSDRSLTDREYDVIGWLTEGSSNNEIGAWASHRSLLRLTSGGSSRRQARSRTELAVGAVREGWPRFRPVERRAAVGLAHSDAESREVTGNG